MISEKIHAARLKEYMGLAVDIDHLKPFNLEIYEPPSYLYFLYNGGVQSLVNHFDKEAWRTLDFNQPSRRMYFRCAARRLHRLLG